MQLSDALLLLNTTVTVNSLLIIPFIYCAGIHHYINKIMDRNFPICTSSLYQSKLKETRLTFSPHQSTTQHLFCITSHERNRLQCDLQSNHYLQIALSYPKLRSMIMLYDIVFRPYTLNTSFCVFTVIIQL